MVQYQQTSLAEPRVCQHKLLQDHDEFASVDGVVVFLGREGLGGTRWQVIAEVVRDLVDRYDDTSEGDLRGFTLSTIILGSEIICSS